MLLLLLSIQLLVLPAGTWAQSGDGASDTEPTLYCTSHISQFEGSNITCQLVTSGYYLEDDDEDEESDAIEKIIACCCKLHNNTEKCPEVFGDTLSSKDLNPISLIRLTALSKKGHRIETLLDLRKIIKPRCPQVYNVTLNQDQAVVHIQIPYRNDYLKLENQLFQLQLWSEKTNMTQNITSESMNIDMNHLRNGTQYHVKVRAIPWDYFQGTWSEWSRTYTFNTPPDESSEWLFILLWIIIPVWLVALVTLGVAFLWKHKILTYMWPSIPHPKTTLGQICGQNSGLLLMYKPEELSSLNVHTMDHSVGPSCSETQPVLSEDEKEETPSCSAQSSDISMSDSSVRTEELELLSQSSSSEGEQDIPSAGHGTQTTLPQIEEPQTTQADHNSITYERDDSYVTMSSFYQIKSLGTANGTAPPIH